jgi:hypothetical protein
MANMDRRKAGTITVAGVLIAGWWMLRSKKETKQ